MNYEAFRAFRAFHGDGRHLNPAGYGRGVLGGLIGPEPKASSDSPKAIEPN